MIQQGISLSAKNAFLLGIHQPGDTYKIALYSSRASIGPKTNEYSSDGEIVGPGYVKGGFTLAGFRSGMAGKNGFVTFDDLRIDRATFSAQGAMIYNASKNNAALCILNFGGERSVFDGTFELSFPNPTEKSALILLA